MYHNRRIKTSKITKFQINACFLLDFMPKIHLAKHLQDERLVGFEKKVSVSRREA
jgi:hypothetical protein